MYSKLLRVAVALTALVLPCINASASVIHSVSISAPAFIIPLDGQHGSLNIFSDGTDPTTSGFNVLGNQMFYVPGRGDSAGALRLNMHFSPADFAHVGASVEGVTMYFEVFDLDFFTDLVAPGIELIEIAELDEVNGAAATLPINLHDYLPASVSNTDDVSISLRPIELTPFLSAVDFTEPVIFSLALSAEVKNTSEHHRKLYNTPEHIFADMHLQFTAVPEPGMPGLFAVALLALVFTLKRKHAFKQR